MKRGKQILSLLLTVVLLLTTCGFAEDVPAIIEESVPVEVVSEPEAAPEPEVPPEQEVPPEPEVPQEAEKPEAPENQDSSEPEAPVGPQGPESDATVAPKLVFAPEWTYDEEAKTLVIPCAAEDETVRFEWEFDGAAAGYDVQIAPLPAEGEEEQRTELGLALEKFILLPIEDYRDGWYTLYIAAIGEDGAMPSCAQVFKLDVEGVPDVEVVLDEATPAPEAEATPMPVIDENPEPAVELVEEIAPIFTVRVEKSVDASFQVVLRAVVETELEGEIAYRWQSLDSAAYQEALQSGGLSDAEALWTDIPDATGEILNPRDYFGEDFLNHCYRAIATLGDQEAVSATFKYDQDETPIVGPDATGEEFIPKTPEELAEYLDMTLEELAEMLGMTMDEVMALTEEEIAFLASNGINGIMPITVDIDEPAAKDKILIYNQYGTWSNKALNPGASGYNDLKSSGCHIYSYAHAIQWLTGAKRTNSNGGQLLDVLINECDIPWGTDKNGNAVDAQGKYDSYIKKAYGVKQVAMPSSSSALMKHFGEGGVIIANPGGHYVLAVGAVEADIDNNGKAEVWVHIVDSSCGTTIGKISDVPYTFGTLEKITSSTGWYRGDEYWVSYASYSKMRHDRAYLPKTPHITTKVNSITLSLTSASLDYSQSVTLTAAVSPSNATNKEVTWSSNSSAVELSATSGGQIMVWGRNPGTAKVTCTAADGSGKSASCTITVNRPSTLQITGVDYPATYRINSEGWELRNGTVSSNVNLTQLRSVIRNSSGGIIGSEHVQTISGTSYAIKNINKYVPFSQIKKAGTYTWTLTASDSSGRTVSLTITFKAVTSGSTSVGGAWGQKYEDVAVTGISLDQSKLTLDANKKQTYTLKPTITPSGATNKNLKWTTDRSSVATVSSAGVVTAVGAGSATITCTAADGKGAKATCAVTVTADKKVTGISLSKYSLTLNKSKKQTETLTATISPSDATNQKVNWMTSNKAVATVSSTGLVTPVAAGSATITCTAADGSGVSKSCSVTVIVDTKVTRIELSETALNMVVYNSGDWKDTFPLSATVSPGNATDQRVNWSSNNASVASVSGTGMVTAHAKGTATITCTAADGSGVKATCKVTVKTECEMGNHEFDYGNSSKCLYCDYVCNHKRLSQTYLDYVEKSRGKVYVEDKYFHSWVVTYDVYSSVECHECGYSSKPVKLYSNVGSVDSEPHDFWSEDDGDDTLPKCSVCGAPNPYFEGEEDAPCSHANTEVEVWYDDWGENVQYKKQNGLTHLVYAEKWETEICQDCGEELNSTSKGYSWIEQRHEYNYWDEVSDGNYTCVYCGYKTKCDHKNQEIEWYEYEEVGGFWCLDTGNSETHEYITVVGGYLYCGDCGISLTDLDPDKYPEVQEVRTESQPHRYDPGSNTCMDCGYTRCANGKHTFTKTAAKAKHDENEHWWVCTKCNAKVDAAAHSFNASGKCAACGYTCPHDHLEQGEETEKLVKCTAVDDANHSRTVKPGFVCPDCGASVCNGAQTILTEEHTYNDNGKCTVCGRTCTHKTRTTEETDVTVTYSELKEATHSSETVTHYEDTCIYCGNVKTRSTTVRKKNVAHSYEDGVCALCDYRCGHTKLTSRTEVERLNWQTTDGPRHIPYNRTTTIQSCAYCGEYIGTLVDEGEGTPEAHSYDDGDVCTVCGIERPVIEGIEIESQDVVLGVSETKSLEAAYRPVIVDDKVVYQSSAPEVAKVNAKGVVTPLKTGTAVITASSEHGDAQDSITVTVAPKPTKIELTATKLTLGVGDEAYVMLKSITPADAVSNITYTSNAPKVASVDAYGNIVALKTGSATITAKTYNGKTAKCSVSVKGAPSKIELNPDAVTLSEGQSEKINVKLPKNTAASYSYEVISGSENVSVDGGEVYAIAEGEATVRVTSHNGQSADYHVTILPAPTEVTLNAEELRLGYSEPFVLEWSIDRGQTEITFVSSDESVAKVSQSGKITAQKKAGNAVITAVAHNGVAASVDVTVVAAPTKIAILNNPKTLGVGEPWTLGYEISAVEKKQTVPCAGAVTFKSSNKGVLDVDPQSGELTAIKKGSAKITATAFNKKSASVTITVKAAPTGISLVKDKLTLEEGAPIGTYGAGESVKLSVSYAPSGSFGNVSWESSDDDVAAVANGTVTAGDTPGTATITARVYDKENPGAPLTTSCRIEVKAAPAPENAKLVPAKTKIGAGESVAAIVEFDGSAGAVKSYRSSNNKNATVSAKGVIKAVKKNTTAVITAVMYNGAEIPATVEIVAPPSAVTIANPPEALKMKVGETWKPEFKIDGYGGDDFTGLVTAFTSSNKKAAVFENGVLRAVAKGSTKITCKTYNGKVSKAITIQVLPAD